MADHDNDISPWERDDWDSSDDPSFESSTAPVGNQLSSRRLRGAHVGIAAGVGAILLIGGGVALVDTTDRQAVGTADSVPASVASTDSAPTTTVGGGVPVFWNAGGVETSDSVADEPLSMADSGVGEAPVWNPWSLDVPAPLDAARRRSSCSTL